MLRGDRSEYNRKALTVAMAVGSVALPLMLLTGNYNARVIANQQPWKLAAAEGLFATQAGAPLHILGWPDPNTQQIYGGIELPKFLSLLAYHNPNATVTGLDAFPRTSWPDPRLVHFVFDAMVGSFFIMLLAMIVFWYLYFRKRGQPLGRWPLLIMLVAAPFGLIALETGWMTTEFGRQPWIAQAYMRVAQAVTPRQGIGLILLVFLLVSLALTAGLFLLLLRRSPPRTGTPQAVEARNA
jgi:cytochrome bd ubiquinol oxidase subunit I